MSDKSNSISNGGFSTVSLLGLVFITLKLCGVIHWSWWWVLAPFWGGVALFIAFLLVAMLIALATALLKG